MDMRSSSWAVLLLVALLSVAHAKPGLRSRRMVGGILAPTVPWQAMVYLNKSILDGGYGGGALISDRWVLTAGRNLFVRGTREHTLRNPPRIPKVYLGILSVLQANKSTEHEVEKVVLHPAFQAAAEWENDLALIKLKHPVVMTDKITPIPLPKTVQSLPNDVVGAVTGWGWGVYLSQAEWLKHNVFPLNNHCAHLQERNLQFNPDLMLCTGPDIFGNGVCTKDAGSALVIQDESGGDVYAAGILSYDKGCQENGYAVYTKVQAYLPWIHKVLRGDTETSAAQRNAAMSKMLALARA